MKTVFILNPMAGKKKDISKIITSINETAKAINADVETYETKGVGDARDFVRSYCERNPQTRFIACGGDGTLNEVLNGTIGFCEAQVGVMPMGTGNDFCRNFENGEYFKDIARQIKGDTMKCDAIKYFSQTDEGLIEGYCANLFNIGFDCNVAELVAKFKRIPLVTGSLAYLMSILVCFLKKETIGLKIELDGKKVYEGELLLNAVANGSYCGGGIYCSPDSSVNDGLMDVVTIKDITRMRFLKLLPKYLDGTYPQEKGIEEVISVGRCKKLVLTPLSGSMNIGVDGESIRVKKTEFEVVEGAYNFVLPEGVKEGKISHSNT